MKSFKRSNQPEISPSTSSSGKKKSFFTKKGILVFLIIFFTTLVILPLTQIKQDLRQRADVVYSQITPEFFCLGLGGIDCDGVKTATESALGCAGLSVTKQVVLDKKYVAQNDILKGDIIFKNGCKNIYNVQEVFIAARDPKGTIHKFVPSGGAKTIYPAQTVSIDSELAISPSDPTGIWKAFGAVIDESGRVVTDSSTTEFEVVEPCKKLSLSEKITVDPSSVIVPATVSAVVSYKNDCKVEFKLQDVLIHAIDPNGNAYDFTTTSSPPAPVSLASGSALTLTGTRNFTTADIMGTWQAYGSYQAAAIGTISATWYIDETKDRTSFTVATRSATPIATKSATPIATKSAVPKTVPKLAKRTILFDFDKYDIKPGYIATLDEVVTYLKTNTTAKISIVGHTDNVGTPTYNMTLSQDRANAVKNYIVGKGIPAARITVSAKGETQPVASNATEAGRAKNRRVEITN